MLTTTLNIDLDTNRGSIIIIDNIECRLRENGEWTANRVELSQDFPGPTNLDAEIKALITAAVIKKRSPKRNKAKPVASSEILDAVSNLNIGSMYSKDIPESKPKPEKKVKKTKESSGSVEILGLSSYAAKTLLEPRVSSAASGPIHSARSDSRSDAPTKHIMCQYHRDSISTKISSPQSPARSTTTNVTSATNRSRVSHAMIQDPTLEPAQLKMLEEIDELTPEEQNEMRAQMNIRMADRVSESLCVMQSHHPIN
jgi:hypothetical protein